MTKKKKFFWWLIILTLIGGGVYYSVKSKKKVTEYTTTKAERQDLAQTVSVSGKIASPNEIDLAFQSTGRLRAVFVDVGDMVKKDQLVAQIDTGTLFHDLEAAKAELLAQRETLANMKEKRNTYTLNQRDAQRAVIEKYEANIASVWKRIDETKIYAPVDAVVGKRNFNSGETEMAGSVVLTLFEGIDLELTANVSESDIIKIKLNQKADLTLDALPADEKLSAYVAKIDPVSTVIQDVVYYKIKLSLNAQDVRLKSGMSTDIDVRTAEKANVLVIPIRAIEISGAEKFVRILKAFNPDGSAIIEKRKIETGLEGDAGLVEVKNGVQENEEVITFTKAV